ncbi:PKD domain-containing protein [Pontiellaceae bacterium B12227]|nr:PKD domain-containing protein [Pontiellaceae bacterium B12227]
MYKRMTKQLVQGPIGLLLSTLIFSLSARADTHYVDRANPSPQAPYLSWSTAATNIQDAVDAAVAGDTVLVANGVYDSGTTVTPGYSCMNRLVITKDITVQSVNGPDHTLIVGAEATGGGCGPDAVRGVYMNTGQLTGFTVTNGYTLASGDHHHERSGGGVDAYGDSAVISNCVIRGNSAAADGGGCYYGTLYHCELNDNFAKRGGGTAQGTIYHSKILRNASDNDDGGGSYESTLHHCTISGNSARSGGGSYYGTLFNCTISDNYATADGGGANASTLSNCSITGNTAGEYGGGINAGYMGGGGAINNCVISGNHSGKQGGGVYGYATLNNCTVAFNRAGESGGGVDYGRMFNCILYHNTASLSGDNYNGGDFSFCCISPLPTSGAGNISSDPKLITMSHLSADSPCIGAGSNAYTNGVDIDGEGWIDPPCIGVDQYIEGGITGALSLAITSTETHVATGIEIDFSALNEGRVSSIVWDFDDGTRIKNQPFVCHSWSEPGDYTVRLTGYNDSNPNGVSTTLSVHIAEPPVYYVAVSNSTPQYPYTNWQTAATSIQDAIDAGSLLGRVVIVSNGLYSADEIIAEGDDEISRVVVRNGVRVKSLDGPDVTTIEGAPAPGTDIYGDGNIRCAYVDADSTLSGFSLINGHGSGGGVFCEGGAIVSNCWISSCSSHAGGGARGGTLNACILKNNYSGYKGGGAYSSLLNSCLVVNNTAKQLGGGAQSCSLYNCTVIGNTYVPGPGSYGGGGVDNCACYNSIIYYNTGPTSWWNNPDPNYSRGSYQFCCMPTAVDGTGNITTEPTWLTESHIRKDSPCAGTASPIYTPEFDIDGDTWNDPPSIGCDEPCAPYSGELGVSIVADFTNGVVQQNVTFLGDVIGDPASNRWDFGDGQFLLNAYEATHAWGTTGTFDLVLTAWNDAYPDGIATTTTVHILSESTFYVDAGNTNPTHPYNSWSTAARNIQDAVNAARDSGVAGSTVLVTNGTYSSGGAVTPGYSCMNRVCITTDLNVRSVNGPSSTFIVGSSSTRGVYLSKGTLSGFTIKNGRTISSGDWFYDQSGAGVSMYGGEGSISNCVLTGNSSTKYGGGSLDGVLVDCELNGNSSGSAGGGCYFGRLYDCTLNENSAGGSGGGSSFAILHQCTLSNNNGHHGGGSEFGELYDCTLTGNSSRYDGGGCYRSRLTRCILSGNSGRFGGGCALYSTLYNCLLYNNSATDGGGASSSWLHNCTVVGNRASDTCGGTFGGTLNNCIVYFNTAGTAGANWYSGNLPNMSFCCTTPDPGGVGNITHAPLFVDSAARDYRLIPTDLCVDAGGNDEWVYAATDLVGTPRVLNGSVDIGAYETPLTLALTAFLQGPYDTNTHAMVENSVTLPLTSPYAADPRSAPAIPSNIVDWVLVELHDTNQNTIASFSGFLDTEGRLLSTRGGDGITVGISVGEYYISIKHRNHLAAMSAEPVPFTDFTTVYDFSTNSSQFAGGADAAVLLEPGVWGLIAGDADGDGSVRGLDAEFHTLQLGHNGYHRSDFNLDGVVDIKDLTLWTDNQTRVSGSATALTLLSNGLFISPERKTLKAGETVFFTASGTTNPVYWGFTEDRSGGALSPRPPSSTVYAAGSQGTGVDVVQAWSGNQLGRAFINVISSEDSARAGKAIIVAGHKSLDDPLWPITDYLGNQAYNTLLYRGFDKENLQYLSPLPNQDVDNDGSINDIAGETTLAEMANTFTNWAMANTDQLFIYLVDHGGTSSGEGYFRLNKSEILMATELDTWLDNIQNHYSNDVTIVIDCCESGSFLEPLAHTGPGKRAVMTACATNEPTYFIAGGQVSFSDAFFSGIFMGLDLADCFTQARDAMSTYQSSWIDADGDGIYDTGADPSLVAETYLGPSYVAGKDIPRVGQVLGNQILHGESDATLWAYDIVSAYPIERVWCAVVPPGHDPDPDDPVADLPLLDLQLNESTGRYEARYNGFNDEGVYKLIFYASDIWDSTSNPRQSFVTQAGYDEGVIILTGGETNSPTWNSLNNMGQRAYATMAARHFDSNTIHYLCSDLGMDADGDGLSDVDATPSKATLEHAISEWAVGMDKLTVYIVAEEYNNGCRLNASEVLSAKDLDGLLDTFQVSNASVNVIMDFDRCGTFVPELAPPSGAERVTIASTSDSIAMKDPNGLLSFTQSFFSHIFEGHTVGDAYKAAKRSVRLASGRLRQKAIIDDNGDGWFSKVDGDLAETRYIGPAFVTGADAPFIGTVIPDTELGVDNLMLWVSDVSDVDGVSNVWCLITPPDYDGTNEVIELALTNSITPGHYEALYTNFTNLGSYTLTFFAQDSTGEISAPAQAVVTRMDEYEADDSYVQATPIYIGEPQTHTFHSSADEDWVKFFAVSGSLYYVEATQLGDNSDLMLDVYYHPFAGSPTNVYPDIDDGWDGAGEFEIADIEITTNTAWEMGVYYVRVSSADTNLWGTGSKYELELFSPTGAEGNLVVIAFDKTTSKPPPGALAIVSGADGVVTQAFGSSVSISFNGLTNGTHTIEVTTAQGYMPEVSPYDADSVAKPLDWYGNPKQREINDGDFQYVSFEFLPMVRAEGRIRDGMTGGFVEGAAINFQGLEAPLTNMVDGFPNNAAYEELWYTDSGGRFPTNTWLVDSDWSLSVSKSGYPNFVLPYTISNATPGDVIQLGDLVLNPIDANTNGIADHWEADKQITDPSADLDGDHSDNRSEFLAGTDPDDATSRLALTAMDEDASTNGFTLHWPSVAGRSYRVEGQPALTTNAWVQVSPTQEASAGQTEMQWTDSSPTNTTEFYRIKLITP